MSARHPTHRKKARPAASRALILGEVHPEYLFDFDSRDPTDEELLYAAQWAEMMGDSTKEILESFGADRIYVEARPVFGSLGRELIGLRRPRGKRLLFAEGEYDPDRLTDARREENMATRLAAQLRRHPRRSVALVCGSSHAENIAELLAAKLTGRLRLDCAVEYVPLPPGLEDAFPRLRARHIST